MEDTVVISLPVTGPLPLQREPSWDELVKRTRRRPGRARTRPGDGVAWWLEFVAKAAGYGTLLAYVVTVAYGG